jgi:transposase-like protein
MQTTQYSPDPTLTPQQHHVLSLLAQGVSITAAAAAVGVHRNTVANWRRTVPAFARELDYACRERSLYWHDQAADLAQKAIEVIGTILHNESAAPSLRLRAAMKILAIASDPQPAPLKPFPTSAAEAEAITGRAMLLQTLVNESESSSLQNENLHNSAQSAQNCTTQTVRRPHQPGRNSPCPCKSGLKFKRCCASQAHASATNSASASPKCEHQAL